MTNKKLIFILGCPRSGSTLLLSFLCGIPNSKVLYETKYITSEYLGNDSSLTEVRLKHIANYFDSFEEEILIEKTPEHVFHLEDIEKLRKFCKRDIYVVYVVRPPVPTILSIIKASKDSPELFGDIDLLGACEKYEESLVAIYNNLILKANEPNIYIEDGELRDGKGNITHVYNKATRYIPYSFCITYRELIEDSYRVLNTLMNSLYLQVDIQSLIDNRISNVEKYLPLISTEKHHVNVLREINEVEAERRAKINEQINEGFSAEYINLSNTIRNYFEHPRDKKTIYDLVVKKEILEVTENPEVYVVVPLYNKESYIEETLASLANQTYKNIRVVIIDDASTDSSIEVTKKYLAKLDLDLREKFSLIEYTTNQGVSFIRNKGLAVCTDILTFCDADDIWDRELVEKSVEIFTKYPYIDCVYSRVLSNKNGIVTKIPSKICNGNVFKDATKYNFLNCGSNLFIKTNRNKDNICLDYDIEFDLSFSGCEDWDFLIQLSQVALFKCTKEYLVIYRYLPNSLSSNKKDQVDMGKDILSRYISDKKEFSRTFTRLFLYYLSPKNLTWQNIKDLDYKFILEVVLDKLKSSVKSYIS